MNVIGEFKAALDRERRWYLVALHAAEADLRTMSPEPVSLEQVRVRIAALEQEYDRPMSSPPLAPVLAPAVAGLEVSAKLRRLITFRRASGGNAEIEVQALAEIERQRTALAAAEAALIGPSDEYEGCAEALTAVRAALYPESR